MRRSLLKALSPALKALPPRTSTVVVRELIAPKLVRVVVEGDELCALAAFVPGQQLDVLTRGVWPLGGRHYSPVWVDHERGALELIAHLHGLGPGAALFEKLRVGDPLTVWGPGGGYKVGPGGVRSVFIGDETNLGVFASMARALQAHPTPGALAGFVSFETADQRVALDALALPFVGGARDPDVPQAVSVAFAESVAVTDETVFYISGRLATVRALRATLRGRGVSPRKVRVKAFWSEDRRGM